MSRFMMYGRFAARLPGFLRHRLTLESTSATVSERLRSRGENFLHLAREAVFARPESPYRFIMREAGCEPGDIESVIQKEGLDEGLRQLERGGVRITFNEFKGRTPLVRGGKTFEIGDASFDNPLGTSSFVSQTTGSTGVPTRVNMELGHIETMSAQRYLSQVSNGVFGQPTIMYRAGLPSSAGVANIITHIVMGNPVRRWMSPVAPADINAPLRFRIAGAMLPVLARAAGQKFPRMEIVPVGDAVKVARAAADFVRSEGSCLVRCAISTSLAVATAAVENGIDLTGVTFMGAAEPATPAKVRGIRASGARYITHYGMNEAGVVGAGCPNGVDDTDVHFMRDTLALVPGSRVPEADDDSVVSFAVTSLMRTAPKIMINVDIDDYGILERRDCGCLLGRLGFDQHLRRIRSSAKLTGRGVTLVGSDIVRVIEEVMPSRFGGGPQDYQLVEEELPDGRTMLTLLINPAVVIRDESEPVNLLYEELAAGRPGASFSGAILKGSAAVRIRRERPVPNARGKQPAFRIAAAVS
jgi:hypothetical protein